MEIISHRGSLDGKAEMVTKKHLRKLVKSDYVDTIELDFQTAKDLEMVCSHSKIYHGHLISDTPSSRLRSDGILTLEEILEEINGQKGLIIDFKDVQAPYLQFLVELSDILESYGYSDALKLQSFKQDLIETLLTLRNDDYFSDVEIGLIINLFKTFSLRNGEGKDKFKNVDFLSLSSELYEWPFVGNDYLRYDDLYSNAKQYAWTWSPPYHEHDQRIENYIASGVDGIITNNPAHVKKLVMENAEKRRH